MNRIHHCFSVGIEKSQPEGPPFQWETRLSPWVVFFLEQLNTNDRFFYSYTNFTLATVRHGTILYVLVASLRSMFTVNDASCTNQLETANKQSFKQ